METHGSAAEAVTPDLATHRASSKGRGQFLCGTTDAGMMPAIACAERSQSKRTSLFLDIECVIYEKIILLAKNFD